MVKLIALDLDGTLMSADHMTVTEETRKALKMAHDMGAKISIATGRTLAIIGDVCQQVPEIDYIIYSNGAGVYDIKADKTIYKRFMPWDMCKDIYEFLDKTHGFFEVYQDGISYYQFDKADYFPNETLPQEFVDELLQQMTGAENIKSVVENKEIEKFTVYYSDREEYKKSWDFLNSIDGLYLASSHSTSMEFTNKDVNKGTALDGMCKALGITADECMAFGDAGNDIEMLEYSKYSFAMANATPECKASAKYETKSNAQDGVAYGIYQIMKNE